MTKYIFEDNEDMTISNLLKSTSIGQNVLFAAGCDKVAKTLLENYSTGDLFYIFYDVSPNNKDTVDKFTNLVEVLEEYNNVYVFPIICIEYIVLKMLDKFGYLIPSRDTVDLVNGIIKTFDWNQVSEKHKQDEYVSSSLEHACKNILTKQYMRCMRNVNITVCQTEVDGKFYLSDCNCDNRYCKLNCIDTKILKAERLLFKLPILKINDSKQLLLWENLGLKFQYTNEIEVYRKIQKFYDCICDNMELERIFIR